MKEKLAFEDPINALSQRVLVTVVAVGHRAGQTMSGVDFLVAIRAVLNSPVRMVDQPLPRFPAFQRHLQCLGYELPRSSLLSCLRTSSDAFINASRKELFASADGGDPSASSSGCRVNVALWMLANSPNTADVK